MFDTQEPSGQNLNLTEYRDKVLGCWTGKNIGGTLGAPFEGIQQINQVEFYTRETGGIPLPNDDLDLQLVWLLAIEEYGPTNLNERILGEYWETHISGMWNEYGVCKSNIRNGLLPPLSGSCNNERWKWSNGAWIRSEIWACLYPGSPDEVAQMAWFDACCDHDGEGIYAEIFTAVLESAAFVLSDIPRLIDCALCRIPPDCRVARAVKLACHCHKERLPFFEARERIVEDSSDLGWFQAPGNLGFVVLGLLYGEGDFGRSIALATNCGDDTDCTAGTAGAIMGIILGRSGLPERWTTPIGNRIVTCAIDTFGQNNILPIPSTLEELTDRVARLAEEEQQENATLVRLSSEPTCISSGWLNTLNDFSATARRLWRRSGYELAFDLPYGRFSVEYEGGPSVIPGTPKTLIFRLWRVRFLERQLSVKLLPPVEWEPLDDRECLLTAKYYSRGEASLTFVPGRCDESYYYLPIRLTLYGRRNPIILHLPLQYTAVSHAPEAPDQDYYDCRNRKRAISQ